MGIWVIIPSGGTGERFGANIPKPLISLGGVPIIVRTLNVFEQHPFIEGIVLVIHEDFCLEYKRVIEEFGFKKVKAVINGGTTRTQSVREGLKNIPLDVTMVMVHDGVRPLVSCDVIDRALDALKDVTAAVAGIPVVSTLKAINATTGIVSETLDRSLVWEIQTPQIFTTDVLKLAYQEDFLATDDAAMVENIGGQVKVFLGDERNIKITTPMDLVIAQALLEDSIKDTTDHKI